MTTLDAELKAEGLFQQKIEASLLPERKLPNGSMAGSLLALRLDKVNFGYMFPVGFDKAKDTTELDLAISTLTQDLSDRVKAAIHAELGKLPHDA